MDNVSFHSAEFAQRCKFVFQRRIDVERKLSEEVLSYKEILDLLEHAGLMKTVKGLSKCFIQLIREFIVNITSDCDNEDSVEYKKVFVRGKCVDFSPEVINNYLGKSPDAVAEREPDLDRVANTLTGRLIKKWPKKGLLPSGKLTAKYDVLYKIGTANWMATQHMSGVTPPLARMLYLIGTRGDFDFGNLVYEQTLKHAGSFAVKLPILFPCLLSGLIVHQHPNIVKVDEPLGKKPLPLKFDYRLFAGTHVPDIMLSAAKGTSSASGTKVLGSSKEDIVAELQKISKILQDTFRHASPVGSMTFTSLWSVIIHTLYTLAVSNGSLCMCFLRLVVYIAADNGYDGGLSVSYLDIFCLL
ncbi:uncharacterized protein LOC130712496 [Lotus japonicus]|uniref:uncharacterized protein LOC130712496 n=1 Tax=Lotus japonicus TaxID=34305 RepID=UPI00258D2048|nr:uncharacterized protein LOC130712496 [Lotus japonicus]